MIFKKDPQRLKARLQDLKTVKLAGVRFVIKKLNPLLDFPADQIPQIFTNFLSSRTKGSADLSSQDLARFEHDMIRIVEAALVEPVLVPVGKDAEKGRENGITIDDIFRDPQLGAELYNEVLLHSLNRFRGMNGLFFSIRMRYSQFMLHRKSLAEHLSRSSSPTETSA